MSDYKRGDRIAYVRSEGGEEYVGRYRDKEGNPGVAEVRYIQFGIAGASVHATMVTGKGKGAEMLFREDEIEHSMKIVNVKRPKDTDTSLKIYGKVLGEHGKIHNFAYVRRVDFRGWICSCDNFFHKRFSRHQNCKHLKFVRSQLGRYGATVPKLAD